MKKMFKISNSKSLPKASIKKWLVIENEKQVDKKKKQKNTGSNDDNKINNRQKIKLKKMKTYQPLKTGQIEDERQEIISSPRYDRNRNNQISRFHFMRNIQDNNGCQPSQSCQSKYTKINQRLKSTRIKNRYQNNVDYQLEQTHKNQANTLQQQNIQLKKIIAQLKVQQFYQINQNKLTSLLLQLDQLKQQMKKIQKQNQQLKIQNDFLMRSNFQLKLENSKLIKKCQRCQCFTRDTKVGQQSGQSQLDKQSRPPSISYTTQAPQYYQFLQDRQSQAEPPRQNYELRSDRQTYQVHQLPKRNQNQDLAMLSRVRSQKILVNNQMIRQSIRLGGKKKNIYTENRNQNGHTIYQ